MNKQKIITGQHITAEKRAMAKELRKNMTPAERRLWNELRAKRLDGWHFRRQQVIDGFIVDFFCYRAGLIIEVDGLIHEKQREADAEREAALKGRGLRLIRFTNQEVMNGLGSVLRGIRMALVEGEE